MFIKLCCIAGFAAVCLALLYISRVYSERSDEPEKSANVKLIKKKKTVEYHPLAPLHVMPVFTLAFLTEREELIEVQAESDLEYDIYHVGDRGVLTYKGKKMIKFERHHINPPQSNA